LFKLAEETSNAIVFTTMHQGSTHRFKGKICWVIPLTFALILSALATNAKKKNNLFHPSRRD
jgi:hypothetical protein